MLTDVDCTLTVCWLCVDCMLTVCWLYVDHTSQLPAQAKINPLGHQNYRPLCSRYGSRPGLPWCGLLLGHQSRRKYKKTCYWQRYDWGVLNGRARLSIWPEALSFGLGARYWANKSSQIVFLVWGGVPQCVPNLWDTTSAGKEQLRSSGVSSTSLKGV